MGESIRLTELVIDFDDYKVTLHSSGNLIYHFKQSDKSYVLLFNKIEIINCILDPVAGTPYSFTDIILYYQDKWGNNITWKLYNGTVSLKFHFNRIWFYSAYSEHTNIYNLI
jgi:hypothetical protein